MKNKKLRKKLKKIPDDADIYIMAYGYSQGRVDKFEIQVIEDMLNYRAFLKIVE